MTRSNIRATIARVDTCGKSLHEMEGDPPMLKQATLDELLQIGIQLEKAAEEIYRGLETRFTHHEPVAAFWRQYAAEEAGHARWLERLRSGLSPERLSQPADPQMLKSGRRLLEVPMAVTLRRVQNLEEAYALADDLEASEMNTIFEFIITEFSETADTAAFLRSQLREHIAKLISGFPERYQGRDVRSATDALA